jgi:hypothetical protein
MVDRIRNEGPGFRDRPSAPTARSIEPGFRAQGNPDRIREPKSNKGIPIELGNPNRLRVQGSPSTPTARSAEALANAMGVCV